MIINIPGIPFDIPVGATHYDKKAELFYRESNGKALIYDPKCGFEWRTSGYPTISKLINTRKGLIITLPVEEHAVPNQVEGVPIKTPEGATHYDKDASFFYRVAPDVIHYMDPNYCNEWLPSNYSCLDELQLARGLALSALYPPPQLATAAEPVATQTVIQNAAGYCSAAMGHMEDRAVTYDSPGGERSMEKTVIAFNALTGHNLTEEQGWLFMETLKLARSQQGQFKRDNYEDAVAYAALRGEAAEKHRKP